MLIALGKIGYEVWGVLKCLLVVLWVCIFSSLNSLMFIFNTFIML
ncbi:hypothetical protein BSPCLSOX_2989 [uncultured Gammaproteobacteria bacterium]|nr:hypothetical protein BSPCLSOX_2989 [uncultured Gammaproteobacteria bacterium]